MCENCRGGAPPKQRDCAELFHCDECDEVVVPLRLHPLKASARYTFAHEVLKEVLELKDAAGERLLLPRRIVGRWRLNASFSTIWVGSRSWSELLVIVRSWSESLVIVFSSRGAR